jgi:hypothetical protein
MKTGYTTTILHSDLVERAQPRPHIGGVVMSRTSAGHQFIEREDVRLPSAVAGGRSAGAFGRVASWKLVETLTLRPSLAGPRPAGGVRSSTATSVTGCDGLRDGQRAAVGVFGGAINRSKRLLTSGNITVGPVGLEPTTYGLKVRSSNH